ncbi:MAG: hypothetical protein HY291_23225 [Planctomycetes bacterium]|nr:hypothetical protein [Planctomycetota bacterium]
MALAKDGNRLLYVGVKNTLYRLNEADAKLKDFAAVKKGEILRGGIALMPGRAVVTTTEGIQLFE